MTQAPPKDIPPSELWTKLSSSKRAYELVDFPRLDPVTGEPLGQVAMWPLKQGEIIRAKAEATRYARGVIKEKFDAVERVEGYEQVFLDACACEILFQACRRPENVELPVFPTPQAVRLQLTSDECAILMNQYSMVQAKLGPIRSAMTHEECEAWITRLREGGSEFPLALLSPAQQTALLMYLVKQHVSSPTDKSSAGSLPDEPTPNIESE